MNGYARAETTFCFGRRSTRGWQTVRDRYHKEYGDRAKMGTLTFSDLENQNSLARFRGSRLAVGTKARQR